jgi:septal ring factor EnvC (AmiA/AmiB activator)
MRNLKTLIVTLVIATLLSGCSSGIQLGYRQLDWLIPGWIDRQVDLRDDQYDALKTSVREQLHWHCTSELPAYADWISNSAAEFSVGLSNQQAALRYDQMVEAWNRLMHQAAIPLSQLAGSFDDAQVEQVLEALRQRNAEYISEYLDHPDAQRREIYVQWMTRALKRRIGKLTDKQAGLVQQWSANIDLLTPELRNARNEAQTGLATLLAQRHDNQALLRGIRQLLREDRSSGSDFDRRYQANTRKALQLLSDLSYTLTDRQKKRLARRSSRIANAFTEMNCAVFQQAALTTPPMLAYTQYH